MDEQLLFSLQIKTRVSRKTKWSEKSQSIICHWKTSLDQAGIWHVELLAVEGSFRQTVRSFNSPPLYTHSTYITWHCATAVICLVMSCPPETTSQCPRSGPTGTTGDPGHVPQGHSSHWPGLLFSHVFPLTDCVTEDVFNFLYTDTAPIVSWDLVIWHLATQIRFIGPTLSPQPDRVWVSSRHQKVISLVTSLTAGHTSHKLMAQDTQVIKAKLALLSVGAWTNWTTIVFTHLSEWVNIQCRKGQTRLGSSGNIFSAVTSGMRTRWLNTLILTIMVWEFGGWNLFFLKF